MRTRTLQSLLAPSEGLRVCGAAGVLYADYPWAAAPAGLVVLKELAFGRQPEVRVKYDRSGEAVAVRTVRRERRKMTRWTSVKGLPCMHSGWT